MFGASPEIVVPVVEGGMLGDSNVQRAIVAARTLKPNREVIVRRKRTALIDDSD